MNALPVPRVAVDIPSGLSGSRPEIPGPHVVADLTVTFAAPKIAHVFPPAADACGALVVADLGHPAPARRRGRGARAPEAGGPLHLLVAEELAGRAAAHARRRQPQGGLRPCPVLAGSPGKAGAAILAARAAVVAGAGLVTVAVPEPLLPTVDLGSLESMTLGLPAGPAGQLAAAAVERALAAAAGKAVLAMGPGLGPEAAEAIRAIAHQAPLPLLLDADGINAFAGRPRDLAGRPAPTVLTPHPGELARLLGITTTEVQADRPAAARRAAAETGAIVLLKGHLSLVATPDGALWVNTTGNPGMASGGSGDVLTGLAAGLLAQRTDDPLIAWYSAVLLAVHLHGLAGDLAAERLGGPAVPATELLVSLPAAFARLAAS